MVSHLLIYLFPVLHSYWCYMRDFSCVGVSFALFLSGALLCKAQGCSMVSHLLIYLFHVLHSYWCSMRDFSCVGVSFALFLSGAFLCS